MTRILLLGGTGEASALARALAERGADAVFSYAGRTAKPLAQPLPTRVGGFGGVDGLCRFIVSERISHVVDATHPFAAGMSAHAVAACHETGTLLCALERPGWMAQDGDDWLNVPDMAAAVAALPERPQRIFLAIGRQNLDLFAARPQHFYLLRLVDPPQGALPLPKAEAVIDRGPFSQAGDRALIEGHAIDIVVAKNSGGLAARAKLDAARALGLKVILIDRPVLPPRRVFGETGSVLNWLFHGAAPDPA